MRNQRLNASQEHPTGSNLTDLGWVAVRTRMIRDEQAAEAVEPGRGTLDDPAASAEAIILFEQLLLLAAGAE